MAAVSSVLDAVPLEPENITREWLLAVINQYRKSKGLSVLAGAQCIHHCNIDECDNSHGYLSTTFKLVVHFCLSSDLEDDAAIFDTYAFFLKMVSGVEERQTDLLKMSQAFPREVEAQFRSLPALRAFIRRHRPSNGPSTSLLASPDIVYGSYDVMGGGVIVLLDLNNQGFFPNDKFQGLDLHQLLVTAERLAELHAVAAAMLHVEPEQRRRLRLIDDSQFVEATCGGFVDLCKLLRRTPGLLHTARLFDCHHPQLLQRLVEEIRCDSGSVEKEERWMSRAKFGLRSLVHGELWEQNLLFRTEVISESVEVVFCDWKRLRVAHPAEDLALLLLSSTSQSTRVCLESQVLEKYYFSLNENVRRLGFRLQGELVGNDVTFDDFRQDYEECKPNAFLRAVPLLMRQLQYLELDFKNVDKEETKKKTELGLRLRHMNRRVLDLASHFIPIITNEDSNQQG